jgi:hypothetical protein
VLWNAGLVFLGLRLGLAGLFVVVGWFYNSLQLLLVCVLGWLSCLGGLRVCFLVVHCATSNYACQLACSGDEVAVIFSIYPYLKAQHMPRLHSAKLQVRLKRQ